MKPPERSEKNGSAELCSIGAAVSSATYSEVDWPATTIMLTKEASPAAALIVIPTEVEESPAAAAQPADADLGQRRQPSCKSL
jgi:hypothetical protein